MIAEVETRTDGSQSLLQIHCDAPVDGAAAVTAAAVRARVQRLVPHPSIGVAPPGGVSLVNVQTLLWSATAADRDLGTLTLVGQRVALRVHVTRVDWTFGDGTRASTTTPGRPYDGRDPCRQARCPQYWGHVYRTVGRMTVSARATWTGEYRVGAAAWQPIAGAVAGPTQSTTLTVREARGVLVPNGTGR